jgi:ketosteroid isomerase-like protein
MKRSRSSKYLLFVLLAAALGHAQELKDEIVAQERGGLEALKTGDIAAFGNTIAEDAVFVDASGPAGKAQVVKNVGLIVYLMDETGTTHGKEFAAKVHVASVWSKRSGKWLCEFSQETAARVPK